MTTSRPPLLKIRLLAMFLGFAVLPILLIALLEAFSSFFLLALALGRQDQDASLEGQGHSRYDPELGWVSVPNTSTPNMFGPKVQLRIDSQGFRETGNPGGQRASARLRVVCSGDSFTFGDGVADHRTWCAFLGAMDSGLATVNMGQSGYGVDQSYLLYKRDARRLDHGIHLFAYITNDFLRMQHSSTFGAAKPMLTIRNDSLVVQNTPVPRRESRPRWYWTAVLVRNNLRLARFLLWARDSVFQGHGMQQGSLSGEWTDEDSLTWMKVRRITGDLAGINRIKGSTLILVHLPVIEDYWTPQSDPWRERAKVASRRGEFVFLDLVQEFRQLPADSAEQMFIGHRFSGYPDASGHYTVSGNQWVASQIYRRLVEIPEVAANLRRLQ
jgi:hypothetical protein